MKLVDLGYNNVFEKHRIEQNINELDVGRIISEHKERYTVRTENGEFEAEITGNLRFSAKGREDFPAVGDWVSLTVYDSEFSIINSIFPRFSTISRQAVGHHGELQIIATNIDYAFLVQAVDRDFNINRLERYLTICYSANVTPIIVLTKTDLINHEKITEILESIKQRIKDVRVIAISNQSKDGYEKILKAIEYGKSYCLLGSSGVGKSTLLNNLSGRDVMRTDAISHSSNKGRHVSSHRELIVLDSGGILIDNPGMREVGVVDSTSGVETTFEKILTLAQSCKFKDCTHTSEIGCAVLEALEAGDMEQSFFDNYLRLEKEKAHFELTLLESRKKDKQFGKMVKNIKKLHKKR